MHERDAREIFVEEAEETWFQDLSKFLTEGGETTALCLSRVAAVDAFQALMGPADSAEVQYLQNTEYRADKLVGEEGV